MTSQTTGARELAAAWRERDAARVASCYHRYSALVVDRAEGAHLHTVDGRDVLDFGCGIAVTNLGHRHPAVEAAVRAQLGRVWHTSVTAVLPAMVEAAEALTEVAPAGLDRVFLCSSGTEAVEAAIKLARRATGRTELIAFRGGFHGRTYGSMTLTASRSQYRAGHGPFLPGVHHVDYGHAGQLGALLATTVPAESVAAIVVEPVLGEGGYVVPPPGFLPALRELCDRHGMLLVVDEVQTGIGRTGRMFAVEHTATRPDILCAAKGLGNGLPIGAMLAPAELMSAWGPGDHGNTYGGNALACAAAVAVIDTVRRERLAERARRLGGATLARLAPLAGEVASLAEVRGLGLMIGLELRHPDGRPAADAVERVRAAALERGLLLLSCGIDGSVIRLAPPLTIGEDELDRGLAILEESLREAG